MSELYKHFSKDWEHCLDYSEDSMLELYYSESYGDECSLSNGYYIGKKYLNLTVAMWKEDIKLGYLFKSELYEDNNYPNIWLDKIFKKLV